MAVIKMGVLPASANSFVAPSVDFSSWKSVVVNDAKTSVVISQKGALSNGHQITLTGTDLSVGNKSFLGMRKITGTVNEIKYSTVTSAGETVHYTVTGLDIPAKKLFANSEDMLSFILSGADEVHGTSFGETLKGYDGKDQLFGYEGDDILIGGQGADMLDGGEGSDTASYQHSYVGVKIDLLNSTASGGTAQGDSFVSIENVAGSHHRDVLIGSDGDNSLWGHKGDDVLRGGLGADVLNGGAGSDTADYSTSLEGVTVDLSGVQENAGGEAAGDKLIEIENVMGSRFNDVLMGDKGANVLSGGEGDDLFVVSGGRDVFKGGEGSDTISYASSEVGVSVKLNSDHFNSVENVMGSAFDDKIWGSSAANILNGGDGQDVFHTGAGDDTVIMGEGNDVYCFKSGTGRDAISDFSVGQDVIDFKSMKELTLEKVKANAFATDEGTVIALGLEGSITLKDVALEKIDWAHDFVFAA